MDCHYSERGRDSFQSPLRFKVIISVNTAALVEAVAPHAKAKHKDGDS
jgi:hypothetical protein